MTTPDPSFVEQLSRLENIQTRWSLIQSSARPDEGTVIEARNALILRYGTAIRSYVAAIVRDEELADDLSQDAVVRLLQGDFAGANPDKGRFRDLLKVALRNMARNTWAKQKVRKAVQISDEISAEVESPDDPWVSSWREHLIKLAWSDLERLKRENNDSLLLDAMKLRVEFPDAGSKELADQLSQRLGRTIQPENFRQQLKRARDRFARSLLLELTETLDDPTHERIQEELVALGLHNWMKDIAPQSSDP